MKSEEGRGGEEKGGEEPQKIWSTTKHTNIHIIGVPEKEKYKEEEKICKEVITETLLNLLKNNHLYFQKPYKTSNRINTKISTHRHALVNILKAKFKRQILKVAKGKQIFTYKETP